MRKRPKMHRGQEDKQPRRLSMSSLQMRFDGSDRSGLRRARARRPTDERGPAHILAIDFQDEVEAVVLQEDAAQVRVDLARAWESDTSYLRQRPCIAFTASGGNTCQHACWKNQTQCNTLSRKTIKTQQESNTTKRASHCWSRDGPSLVT